MIPSLHFMDGTTITEFARQIRHKIILQEEKMVLSDDPRCDLEHELSALEEVEAAIGTVIGYMNAEFEASVNKIVEKKKEHIEHGLTIRQLWESVKQGERVQHDEYIELANFITENHDAIFGPCSSVGCYWDRMSNCWDLTVAQTRKHVELVMKQRALWAVS